MSENNESTAAAVEPSESQSGLLDGVTAQEDGQIDSQQAQPEISHIAPDPQAAAAAEEDDPLDRPEYWPENFWNKDTNEPDLEGIAKSWMDLRKQISQGKHKAPADGKYDLKAFGDEHSDHPIAQTYVNWAKENGISQAAFDGLAAQLDEIVGIYETPSINIEEEKKALGPNADAVMNGMVNWARGLVNKGIWNADDFEEFKVMGGTAKGLRALMKVRESYEGRIPVESTPVEGAPTDLELQAMVGDPKYQSDPSYRAKVERLFNQRYS